MDWKAGLERKQFYWRLIETKNRSQKQNLKHTRIYIDTNFGSIFAHLRVCTHVQLSTLFLLERGRHSLCQPCQKTDSTEGWPGGSHVVRDAKVHRNLFWHICQVRESILWQVQRFNTKIQLVSNWFIVIKRKAALPFWPYCDSFLLKVEHLLCFLLSFQICF